MDVDVGFQMVVDLSYNGLFIFYCNSCNYSLYVMLLETYKVFTNRLYSIRLYLDMAILFKTNNFDIKYVLTSSMTILNIAILINPNFMSHLIEISMI